MTTPFDTTDLEKKSDKLKNKEPPFTEKDMIDLLESESIIKERTRLKAEVEKVIDIIVTELKIEQGAVDYVLNGNEMVKFVNNIKKRLGI